ncbi:MurR/RpiR family transcriptional regulator [Sporosarcina sp. D27]|uniref:MurR/RpiR family transcriptional regulator n=1 Tax=Sporosarcina sp. D27 TaxID=1382305 RepID=UPI00046F6F40|nr:MurR/RpiR family transcriptional regulator [Sporosarcina sp. D27]
MDFIGKTKAAYPNLTSGLKKVADALLINPIMFATHPAKKIASLIDVSETMIIRFAKSIGYPGFGTLQTEIQRSLLSLTPPNGVESTTVSDPYSGVMESDSKNIAQIANQLDWKTTEAVVDHLSTSTSIKVVGYYQSYAYAHWFTFLLNSLLGNTSLYHPETEIGISTSGRGNCVVLFSFYRYALGSIRLAKEAKERENTVIIITDSLVSPANEFADYTLVIPISQKSVLEKGPVTFSFLNSILLHIAKKTGKLSFVNPTSNYFINEDTDNN